MLCTHMSAVQQIVIYKLHEVAKWWLYPLLDNALVGQMCTRTLIGFSGHGSSLDQIAHGESL